MTPDAISDALERDILGGVLAPGSVLPQGALAARFGVSRIPVRDALARLALAGLVELTPNRRARVVEMTLEEVIEAFDLRLMLETDLFARALERMTPQDLDRIDYALARSDLEARNANWAEGDALFHAALYAPAQRPRQQTMIDGLRRACRVQIASYESLPEDTDRWLADHAALRDLCRAGEKAAATERLRTHLTNARDTLLSHLA
ncbi:GntR family transcriptional regulator [Roseovarius sp.]|uniref:GntR family transcriptional regulator n=1 Tax=Roseovarius sp. TaxID=1486281 RepID=UPI003BA8A10B